MKTILAAVAAVCILPGAACAGTGQAAATLPNTFDQPAARQAAPAPAPVPAPTQAPTPAALSDPAKVAAAEAALKTSISAIQNDAPNYDDMSADLAAQVREQAPRITPLIQGFGALQSVTHVGTENGAELFSVIFDKQATQWVIGLDAEGKIAALLFRPAPAA